MSLNIKISNDLVNYLEEVFPDRMPSSKTTERELWVKAGQVEVVRFLRDLKEREEEEDVLR